ncbi:MAG: glycosyltransferase family 2 protein [Methanobacteriota archaeon]|nr:MAG: glycosyltransferase family 2 protein [Euryarchaeota archaeon]
MGGPHRGDHRAAHKPRCIRDLPQEEIRRGGGPTISVVIPTYNEKPNLRELVSRIDAACREKGMEAEMVIVDDNSPDGTGDAAEELGKEFNVKVVHREGKLGLSTAVLEGFETATGDVLVVMDADLSHPPEKVPELAEKIVSGEAGMAVGSRYVEGGRVENWPLHRRLVSRGATLLARWLTDVKDPMSGFFAINRSVIEGVELDPVGYKIGLEILVKGRYDDVVEVPITFADRKAGSSKLGASVYLKYIDHCTRLYEHNRPWLARYIKFAFIGGIGALINLAVLWTSVEIFFVHYLWAAVIAFVVADTNNYIWNRWWTFRSKGKVHVQYGQFLLVSLDGLMLNLIILKAIVEDIMPALGIGEDRASVFLVVAQLIAIFLVSIFNFMANSLWTFHADIRRGS